MLCVPAVVTQHLLAKIPEPVGSRGGGSRDIANAIQSDRNCSGALCAPSGSPAGAGPPLQ